MDPTQLDLEVIKENSWILSPIHLAVLDSGGKWEGCPHLWKINEELTRVAFSTEGERVLINVPYRHGKSLLSSKYFPAWYLLNFPDKCIILVACEEDFAIQHGAFVQEVIKRWGPSVGIHIKKSSRAKGEWQIEDHDGGMVCRGIHGSTIGRDADLFLIDDLVKNAEQAMSKVIMDAQKEFYNTVVFGRIMIGTSVVIIGTRWTSSDIFGHVLEQARHTGEKWKHIKFRAIAGENDILGRKPGEALWPRKVSLAHLKIAEKVNPWWSAAWQQEPADEEGEHFNPQNWPTYLDNQNGTLSLQKDGVARKIVEVQNCTVFVTVDWAFSVKKAADFSAIGCFALTPGGELLILDVVNRRLGLHELAREIAGVCRNHKPAFVAVESGHPSLRDDCVRYPEIPTVRWLNTGSKDKLVRAVPAVVKGAAGDIYRPKKKADWWDDFEAQLKSFNGLTDEHDDMVDMTAYAAQISTELKPRNRSREETWPDMLCPGRESF